MVQTAPELTRNREPVEPPALPDRHLEGLKAKRFFEPSIFQIGSKGVLGQVEITITFI